MLNIYDGRIGLSITHRFKVVVHFQNENFLIIDKDVHVFLSSVTKKLTVYDSSPCSGLVFMHLADAFIQSDLQCIQVIQFFVSVCVPWELNSANAMLYHWATGLQCCSMFQSAVSVQLQRALHNPSQGIGVLPRERLKLINFLTMEAQFFFDILHKYSHNKIFWGPWKMCENY